MLSPAEVGAELERFTEFVGSPTQSKTVLAWSPGTYTYLCAPTPQAVRFLSRRIQGPSLSRRLGSRLFRLGSLSPSTLAFVPTVTTQTVAIPEAYDFDVAIAGYRMKLLDFADRTVLTLPIDASNPRRTNLLRTEIDVRRGLPDSLPSPSVIETNREYPFLVEAFVDGEELTDPVAEWETARSALSSLRPLYLQNPSDLIPMETVLADVTEAVTRRGLSSHPVITSGLDLLEELPLPAQLRWCRIHGDFHAGNLLVSGDDVYVLDWEDTRIGYPTTDFFKLFRMPYLETGDPTYIVQMIQGTGVGGDIGHEYGTELGPTVYGDETFYGGLVVLALLGALLERDDPVEGPLLTLLAEIDDRV